MTAAESDRSGPRVEDLTRITLRPLASPLPVGLLGLAVGSLLVSSVQLGWLADGQRTSVALALLVFVVPLEAVSAVLCFAIRDVVMATALGLLTGSWAATGVLELVAGSGTSPVLGELAVAVAVALVVPAVAVGLAKPASGVLLVVAGVRFAMTGVYQLSGNAVCGTVSGVLGLLLVAASAYSSLAYLLEDSQHHAVLPVSRRSTSEAAMSGNLDRQLRPLAREAGVRLES